MQRRKIEIQEMSENNAALIQLNSARNNIEESLGMPTASAKKR